MTDFARTARPDVLVAGGQDLDVLLGPLAAFLEALEARVAALEGRLSAVPLMTAADAAAYARVNVETILRAVRAGELSVAGYIGRSPRISRDAVNGWLAPDHPQRRRLLRSPASIASDSQTMLSRRHGRHLPPPRPPPNRRQLPLRNRRPAHPRNRRGSTPVITTAGGSMR
jgi:excisionase family DNA binding protein